MASTKDKKKKRRRRRVRAPPQQNVRASNLTRATPTNILLEQQALGRLIKNVSTAGLEYSQPVYDEYVRNINQRSIAQRYNRPDVNETLGVRARQLVRDLVRPHGHAPPRERSQRVGTEPASGEPPRERPQRTEVSELSEEEGHVRDRNVFERVDARVQEARERGDIQSIDASPKVREAEERGDIQSIDVSPIKQERDIRLQEDLGQVADRAVKGLEGIDEQLAALQGDVGGMEANLSIPEVSAIAGPPQPQSFGEIAPGDDLASILEAEEQYATPEAQIRRPDPEEYNYNGEKFLYDPNDEAKSDDTPIPGTPTPSYLADYDTDTDAQLEYNYDETPSTSAEYTSVTPSTSEEYTSVTPTLLDQIRAEVGGEIQQPIQYDATETIRRPRIAAEVDPSNIIDTPEGQIRTRRQITSTPALDLADMLGIGSGDGGRTATRAQVEELMREM